MIWLQYQKSSLNANLYSDGDSSGAENSYSIENIKSAAKRKLKLAEKQPKPRKSPGPKKSKAPVNKNSNIIGSFYIHGIIYLYKFATGFERCNSTDSQRISANGPNGHCFSALS